MQRLQSNTMHGCACVVRTASGAVGYPGSWPAEWGPLLTRLVWCRALTIRLAAGAQSMRQCLAMLLSID